MIYWKIVAVKKWKQVHLLGRTFDNVNVYGFSKILFITKEPTSNESKSCFQYITNLVIACDFKSASWPIFLRPAEKYLLAKNLDIPTCFD